MRTVHWRLLAYRNHLWNTSTLKKTDYQEFIFSLSHNHCQTVIEIMGNAQTSTTKFGDYKDVSGILFPYKKSITSGPQELDFTTSEIDLNSELDPKIFN